MRAVTFLFVLPALCAGCSEPPDPRLTNFKVEKNGVAAQWDEKSGRLKKIEMDQDKNGRMDTFSYWDASRLLRIEIDKDEDGKVERWEHYDADNKMVSVGTSSKDDGVEDTWAYVAKDGLLDRIEYDTDRDGVVDKREVYGPKPGDPLARVVAVVELDVDKTGRPERRLYYKPDGSFDRVEAAR
jgi:hypothetical protein